MISILNVKKNWGHQGGNSHKYIYISTCKGKSDALLEAYPNAKDLAMCETDFTSAEEKALLSKAFSSALRERFCTAKPLS